MMSGGLKAPPMPESIDPAAAYTAWAARYIHEYDVPRETFGRVALNMRANAARNPKAAMKTPLTMEAYLQARMIRDPLCMLDMDIPVDGADAFVLTTTEKAKSSRRTRSWSTRRPPAWSARTTRTSCPSLERHGQHVVVEALKERSDVWIDDIDVFFPYDGFSIITLGWIENMGFAKPGQAGQWMQKQLGRRARLRDDRRSRAAESARRIPLRGGFTRNGSSARSRDAAARGCR